MTTAMRCPRANICAIAEERDQGNVHVHVREQDDLSPGRLS